MRIVSLAPTQTEILVSLGRADYLAGVTENCDYPPAVRGLPTFGTWYAPDLHRVIRLRPDLVCTFGKHQEDMRDTLLDAGVQVYHSDPDSVGAALKTFTELARLTNSEKRAVVLCRELKNRLEKVERKLKSVKKAEPPRVLRIMHWDPFITVGPGSFQYDVIERAGGQNITTDGPSPYFVCDPAVIQKKDPEAIFFCEPHLRPLLKNDPSWKQVSAIACGRVFVFDCGLTCRSGPRIVSMVEELAEALYPEPFSSSTGP